MTSSHALTSRCRIALAGTGGEPCQAPAGHQGRGHDLTGQPWSHAYVPPCRRCGQPHPTDADRSACPWTDQPLVEPPAVGCDCPAVPGPHLVHCDDCSASVDACACEPAVNDDPREQPAPLEWSEHAGV